MNASVKLKATESKRRHVVFKLMKNETQKKLTSEEYKLKKQARHVRRLILELKWLIETLEMPIELKYDIILNHKNLNTVWKEIGIIPIYVPPSP